MYRYLILFLFYFTCNAQINTQLLNNHWIKTKIKMADGSKNLLDAYYPIYQWRVINNRYCEDYNPLYLNNKDCINFTLEKNFIRTSAFSGYQIEKLTDDSLIVVQKVNGIKDDKLNRIWFTKSSKAKKEIIFNTKNDSVLIASKDFTPSISKDIIQEIIFEFHKKQSSLDFTAKGNIVIFPKSKEVTFEVTETNGKNEKNIDLIKNIFAKSYPYWGLSDFKNFQKVYIPLSLNIKVDRNDLLNIQTNYAFFNTDHKSFFDNKNIRNTGLSKNLFDKAIQAYEKKKDDEAIKLFFKSQESDITNLDALYNIVSISLSKNDIQNACEALKRLKNLEQIEGIKLYKEKCNVSF